MVVVVDYDAGNLYNVAHALKFLGVEFQMSGDPQVIRRAERVILPGVGSARAAMASLDRQGLTPVLRDLTAPFLGICLGLQVLFERSEEEDTPCLGILKGSVRKFDSRTVKVPHMGWNTVRWSDSPGAILEGIPQESYFYFVHSYAAPVNDFTAATTCYDVEFASVVACRNFLGFQFHPERSGEMGLRLIRKFLCS